MLHALPMDADPGLSEQLVKIAHRNASDALYRCHRALELDEDSGEAANSLAEALARLLAIWIFADAAITDGESA